MKKMLTMLLALSMLLTMGFASTASAAEITDYRTYALITSEVEHWNIFESQGAVDLSVLTNCIDGLLTNDVDGALQPNAAKEYYSEDGGLTWTFVLNDNMYWYNQAGEEMAQVTSADWVTGLEWVLNFSKNGAANTSMPIAMIEGAGEYYEYTKAMAEDQGDEAVLALGTEKFLEMVGIETPDEYTIVYHCTSPMTYFPSVATYNCLYPLSAALVESLGGAEGYQAVQPETLWYSGPYIITEYIHQNEKVYTANPNYWNKDNVKLFNTITVKMVESVDVAYNLFQTGEIDVVSLNQSTLQSIYNSDSHEFHDYLVEGRPSKYSYQIHFNYYKMNEDGTEDTNWNTAIANEAFRLAWYYGLDLTSYLARTNAINPMSCENYVYTGNAVAVLSDGTDYTQVVRDKIGLQMGTGSFARVDADKAAAYKAQAIEELTALGVTFPVEIDYYISGSNQTAKDTADVLTQIFSDCLGDDFVKFNTLTYVSSYSNEVVTPQLHSIAINGWGADYADPLNFLGQETYGDDNAYYAVEYSNVDGITDETLIATYEEFTALVKAADAIVDDLDARYTAFADAEAYFINHALAIPCMTSVSWQLTCANDYSKVYTAYGIQAERYVNWETNDQIYTTAEYADLKAAYEAK